MARESQLERLLDLIYRAAIEPEAWGDFVKALSEAFAGSAVRIGFGFPRDSGLARSYSHGIDPAYCDKYLEQLIDGLPWKAGYTAGFTDRCGSLGEVFDGLDFSQSEFYRTWFEPQGLAAQWPIGHSIVIDDSVPIGGVWIFRTAAADTPFTSSDLAFGDRLVRHITRACHIYATLGGVRRERFALAEVIDRLPTGVILLDTNRQPVVTNLSADRIIALDDGFRIDKSGPCAKSARENAILQKLLADVLDARPGHELESSGFLAVSRPSEKRAFPVMVTPLLAAPPGSQAHDAVAAIFVSDPESGMVSATEVLETLYSLTHAEAQLVRLLSQGKSLEEAAAARGVSIHTARSHLKHAFSKTDTRRQGELVRLVLTGVASFAEAD